MYSLVVKPIVEPLNYMIYGISGLCFIYFVYSLIYIIPKIKKFLDAKVIHKFKFTKLFATNYGFKTAVFGTISIIFNFGFVILQGVVAIQSKSAWYGILAIYYLILTVIGSVIVLSKFIDTKLKRKPKTSELTVYKMCGIMLIVLTLAFIAMMGLTINSLNEISWAGIMVYFVATFTVYKLVVGIVGSIKAKKQEDYYAKSIRNLNLATAIISIFLMEITMLDAFATETTNVLLFNILTGLGISIAVIFIGIYMIVKSVNVKRKERAKNMVIKVEHK
jgi:hypothetical protein